MLGYGGKQHEITCTNRHGDTAVGPWPLSGGSCLVGGPGKDATRATFRSSNSQDYFGPAWTMAIHLWSHHSRSAPQTGCQAANYHFPRPGGLAKDIHRSPQDCGPRTRRVCLYLEKTGTRISQRTMVGKHWIAAFVWLFRREHFALQYSQAPSNGAHPIERTTPWSCERA